MKKIKVSKLFEQSAYHGTKADDELIKAILEQSKHPNGWERSSRIKKIIIFVGIVFLWFLAYLIFTIAFTQKLYTTPPINSPTTGETTPNTDNREEEIFQDIEGILLQKAE